MEQPEQYKGYNNGIRQKPYRRINVYPVGYLCDGKIKPSKDREKSRGYNAQRVTQHKAYSSNYQLFAFYHKSVTVLIIYSNVHYSKRTLLLQLTQGCTEGTAVL